MILFKKKKKLKCDTRDCVWHSFNKNNLGHPYYGLHRFFTAKWVADGLFILSLFFVQSKYGLIMDQFETLRFILSSFRSNSSQFLFAVVSVCSILAAYNCNLKEWLSWTNVSFVKQQPIWVAFSMSLIYHLLRFSWWDNQNQLMQNIYREASSFSWKLASLVFFLVMIQKLFQLIQLTSSSQGWKSVKISFPLSRICYHTWCSLIYTAL